MLSLLFQFPLHIENRRECNFSRYYESNAYQCIQKQIKIDMLNGIEMKWMRKECKTEREEEREGNKSTIAKKFNLDRPLNDSTRSSANGAIEFVLQMNFTMP